MIKSRMGLFVAAIAVAVASSAFLPRGMVQQGSPCRVAADTGAVAVSVARAGLTDNDSTGLVAWGLPYRPTAVSLVSDSATCQTIINNYNAALTDTSRRSVSGYVVHADSAFVLYLPPKEVSYFDKTLRYLFSQWALD